MPSTETLQPDVEARLAALEERLRTVEARTSRTPRPGTGRWPAAAAPISPPASQLEPAPAARRAATPPTGPVAEPPVGLDLERLFGGRVLAWVGAVAVVAGLALLFALGIREGWIDEGVRVAFGAGLAALLVGAGVWLQEREDRTEAASAAAAAGFAGLFLAVTVATRSYGLVPAQAGLALAAVIAVATAVVAIRWRAQVVGAVGIVGALLAPVMAGLPFGGGTAAYLLLAVCGATFVLLYERWTWLSFAVLILPAVQWAGGVTGGPHWQPLGIVVVLAAFGTLNVVAALGVELRTKALLLRAPAAYLLALNALLLATIGAFTLTDAAGRDVAALWLLGLAVVHVGAGLAVRTRARDLSLFAYALAMVVADLALTVVEISPTARIVLWVGSAVAVAAVARTRRTLPDGLLACGLGGQLALALLTTLLQAQDSGLADEGELIVALAALAAGCLVSGRLTAGRPGWRVTLDAAGLLAVAVLGFVALDGVALTLAWAGLAVALAQVARRTGDELSRSAAALFLTAAAAWCVGDQAPPTALLDGEVVFGTAVLGLGAVLAAAVATLRGLPAGRPARRCLEGAVAVGLLYLASLAVVAVSPVGSVASGGTGQFALTALWAVAGVAALVVGLRLRRRSIRRGALALLGLAIGKVFLFDLATLTPMARVASFLAVGVLLLVGAFAYQRLRPEPEPEPEPGPEVEVLPG